MLCDCLEEGMKLGWPYQHPINKILVLRDAGTIELEILNKSNNLSKKWWIIVGWVSLVKIGPDLLEHHQTVPENICR